MTATIEVSDPTTWPERLSQYIEDHTTGWASDDDTPWNPQPDGHHDFADCFAGVLVRAFHATRLLRHEEEAIRAAGLVRLDRNLQLRRVEQAIVQGHLTAEQGERILRHAKRLIISQASARLGQVCFCVGRDVFAGDSSGFSNLLCSWGGESLYANLPVDSEDRPLVRSFGRPSLVVAGLDLSGPGVMAGYQWDGLLKALVRAQLGRGGASTEVFYERDVPGIWIEDIWQPGDSEFGPLEGWCSEN